MCYKECLGICLPVNYIMSDSDEEVRPSKHSRAQISSGSEEEGSESDVSNEDSQGIIKENVTLQC